MEVKVNIKNPFILNKHIEVDEDDPGQSYFELIDEFKDYKNLIEYAIDLFDITFNYYIKKLEPEILRYYVTLYHNRNYTEEFESTEDCKFTLMIKGLRKMCIALIKNKFSYYS